MLGFDHWQVLKVNDSNSERPYFVHYVGWNRRYDEWIGRDVIVGLANATPARAGRTPKSLTKVKKWISLLSNSATSAVFYRRYQF